MTAPGQPVLRPELRQPRLGATTSASASSTRSTTSRSPTRRRTPGCSTPWPRTSSRAATTSASWSGPILVSRTYQLDYETNDTNKFDKNNFSHAYVRPLMAEQVVDVLNAALGVEEPFAAQDAPRRDRRWSRSGRAGCEPEPRLRPAHLRPAAADHRLRLRAGDGAGPAADAVPHDRPGPAAEVQRQERPAAELAQDKLSDEEIVEELFLATLARLPKADEKDEAVKHLAGRRTARRRSRTCSGR